MELLEAWREFLAGKKRRHDVAAFQTRLIDRLFGLQRQLARKTYAHQGYQAFNISDPKPRNIHKATVRDRLVHHLIYRGLHPFFDRIFIHDSYSCREGKGTHRAMDRFAAFAGQVSRNHTRTCWVLKCDIRKFFASIDHGVLKEILARRIPDKGVRWLLDEVIDSFHTPGTPGTGLPLGNLTSQLLVNVYMNEFDQFVKRDLKVRHYIRYADDFVLLSDDRAELAALLPRIEQFLWDRLRLALHPDKVFIQTFASGVDFLGWVHFPHHRQLRATTRRRMARALEGYPLPATVQSYRGLLSHGATYRLRRQLGLDA